MWKALKSIDKKGIKAGIVILLVLFVCVAVISLQNAGERSLPDPSETLSAKTTGEAVNDAAETTVKGDPDTNKAATSQAGVSSESTPAAASQNGQSKPSTKTEEAEEVEEVLLSVTGGVNGAITFSLSELKALGAETYSYSMRNKEKNNARQFVTYSGVPLRTLLTAAGWDGTSDTIRITCSDGYNGKYSISEIDDLFAFKNETDTSATSVPAMLAIVSEGDSLGNGKTYSAADGTPLRLVYGQEDYDCAEMKDFNTQGWGYYVCKIELL